MKITLPKKLYDVLLVDPPWDYYGSTEKWAAAAKFYPLIPDNQMVEIGLGRFLTENGVMFLWATSPRLDFAVECIKSWNLHYRGVAFVWVKTKKDGLTPIGAQGVRPSIVKPTTEYVLAASPIKKGRPMPLASEAVCQVVLAPRMEHSRKPDEVHRRIEALYPKASKCEVFARRKVSGWDCVGNEV